MEKPIERARRILGVTQAELARRLKRRPSQVNHWFTGYREVPENLCPAIERLTDGKVTCEELRPDVDWTWLQRLPAA